MIETHYSFVNSWECDENRHMNVQFYLKRFEEAASVFALKSGYSDSNAGDAFSTRHIRYHRELHEGDGSRIESALVKTGAGSPLIVHLMRNTRTGEICATALDHLATDCEVTNAAGSVDAVPEAAVAKGLSEREMEMEDWSALLAKNAAITTNYSIFRSEDFDHSGRVFSSRIVSRYTDGAPHIWDHSGISTNWLQENNFGRVAVEMKVTRISNPHPGDVARLCTRMAEINGRTFRVEHQLYNETRKNVIARGDVRCLVMDLQLRKAVNLPDTIRKPGEALG